MPGHQNARPGLGAFVHRGGRRLAEPRRVTFVQELHDPQVLLSALQHELEQAFHVEVDVCHRRKERFLDERADLFIKLAQSPGVVCVRRHALQPVQERLLQRLHVRVFSADAGHDAARPVGRLFTLIAEHGVLLS